MSEINSNWGEDYTQAFTLEVIHRNDLRNQEWEMKIPLVITWVEVQRALMTDLKKHGKGTTLNRIIQSILSDHYSSGRTITFEDQTA